ncbi:dihydrofolate reductase family protein [Kribbella sp. NPDC026611]|uniref:dihydrofolate reductase family protein n=1 Tax=Kribbella sp. NPDC026611 TaxID=3154911 RepID=UPI0033DB9091
MRSVIAALNLTLDGALSGPNGELDWMFPDPQLNVEFTADLRAVVDTMLTGRNAYQQLNAAFTAQRDHPDSPPELVDFATWMVETPKIVFSNTLTELLSPKDRLATAGIPEEIAELKQTDGCGLVIFGGVDTVQQFARHNVIDEYWIKLYPVALGNGRPLFTSRADLTLVSARAYTSGIQVLRYVPQS